MTRQKFSKLTLVETLGYFNLVPGQNLLKFTNDTNIHDNKSYPEKFSLPVDIVPGIRIKGTDGVDLHIVSFRPSGEILSCEHFSDQSSKFTRVNNHDWSDERIIITQDGTAVSEESGTNISYREDER